MVVLVHRRVYMPFWGSKIPSKSLLWLRRIFHTVVNHHHDHQIDKGRLIHIFFMWAQRHREVAHIDLLRISSQ